MKKLVFVTVLVMISAWGIGQKVNFSGSWTLDREKSTMGDQFSLALQSLILKHTKKTLDSEKHYEFQGEKIVVSDHYTLDGKECENTGWMDSVKKSTAVWDKKKKLLTINTITPMQDGGEATIIEEFVLNGENLVIESTATSSYGELVERFVFDKQ